MVDGVAQSVPLPRISMILVVAFAVTALVVAGVGIYSVASYALPDRWSVPKFLCSCEHVDSRQA